MSIAIEIKKIRRNLNDFGLQGVITKGVQYLLKGVYANRTYRIYRRNLSGETFPAAVLEGVTIRVINADDRSAVRQIEEMEEWLKGRLLGIMSHGMCVAAFEGDTVVGFNLVAFGHVHISLLNLDRRIRPQTAWSEQITVLKTYRKQGLASALRYHVFAELKKRGIRRLYGGTLVTNIPSQRSAAKVGFRFIVDVNYRKFLNQERHLWRRVKHVGP